MNIIKGIAPTAPKLIIHGLSGSGKSTLASKLDKPVFLDLEGGLDYIDCERTEVISNLDTFYAYLVELYHKAESKEGREYNTIVIDSADWLMRKVTEKAAGIDRDNLEMTLNKSNGGYGNGKQVLENHVRAKLLPTLTELNKKGYSICLVAHSDRKDLMDADGIDSTRITPKIDVNTMNVFVEWADNVFYLKRDASGERILVLDGDDFVLAKNRLGMTGEVKLADIDIKELLKPKKEK